MAGVVSPLHCLLSAGLLVRLQLQEVIDHCPAQAPPHRAAELSQHYLLHTHPSQGVCPCSDWRPVLQSSK